MSALEELAGDAREAKLRNKIYIHSLSILFQDEREQSSSSSSSSLWMDGIEALEPHHKLEKLEIKGYKGSRLPDWMSSPLNFVKEIKLDGLSELSSLPPMGKLPFLKVLKMEELKVGREFLGIECSSSSSSSTSSNDVVAFPKLERLEFSGCFNWSDITAEEEESSAVSIMPCLTVLRIDDCWDWKKLPHRLLGKASSSSDFLNIDSFHVGSGFNKLGLLKNLNLGSSAKLKIHLSSMSDVEELVEDARELRNVINIHGLYMSFIHDGYVKERSSPSSSSSLWMDVIEALEPFHKLTYLRIMGYEGSRLPHWMSSPHNLIKQIRLFGLSAVSSLPPMGKLPCLESLHIEGMKELKLVGREFLGIECSSSSSSTSSNDVVVAFPKLRELYFLECPEWSEWEDITAEEEESTAVSIMPCLTDLRIKNCGGLKKLPHRLLRKASSSSLEFVYVSDSPQLHKSYGSEDGSSFFAMRCRNNPHLDIL